MTPDESPEAIRAAAEAGDADAMFHYGLQRHEDGDEGAAVDWWRRAAEAGSASAMHNLGIVHEMAEQFEESERWWRRLAETGDGDAMGRIGMLRMDAGDTDGALEWWRKAAEAGDGDSMFNLAVWMLRNDDSDAADQMLRMAAGHDNPDALRTLGRFAGEAGLLTEARLWLERAALEGDTEALEMMEGLPDPVRVDRDGMPSEFEPGTPMETVARGLLAERQGNRIGAENYYREAAATGLTQGMYTLANLLKENGEFAEAEQWYRRAAETGHIGAQSGLAGLLHRRGEVAEARRWFGAAVEQGDHESAFNLGLIHLQDDGDADAAVRLWLRAADGGDPYVHHSLGLVYYRQERTLEAELWFRCAAENDQPDSLYHLGLMAAADDDLEAAREWYLRAAELGRTGAVNNLAGLCHRLGEYDEAHDLYRRAIASDDSDSRPMFNLGLLLFHVLERPDEAQRWWRRAAELGNEAAAAKLAMLGRSG